MVGWQRAGRGRMLPGCSVLGGFVVAFDTSPQLTAHYPYGRVFGLTALWLGAGISVPSSWVAGVVQLERATFGVCNLVGYCPVIVHEGRSVLQEYTHTGVLCACVSAYGPVRQWYCGHLSRNAVFPCNAIEHFQQTHQALCILQILWSAYMYVHLHVYIHMHTHLLEMCVCARRSKLQLYVAYS